MLAMPTAQAQTVEILDSSQIEEALLGNSVLHPSFGCVFYKDKSTAVLYSSAGVVSKYSWRIKDGKYYSTGSCEALGCSIGLGVDVVEFTRVDKGYFRRTNLVKGNACEAGILST